MTRLRVQYCCPSSIAPSISWSSGFRDFADEAALGLWLIERDLQEDHVLGSPILIVSIKQLTSNPRGRSEVPWN